MVRYRKVHQKVGEPLLPELAKPGGLAHSIEMPQELEPQELEPQ